MCVFQGRGRCAKADAAEMKYLVDKCKKQLYYDGEIMEERRGNLENGAFQFRIKGNARNLE